MPFLWPFTVHSSKSLFPFAVCLSQTSFQLFPSMNLLLQSGQSSDSPRHAMFIPSFRHHSYCFFFSVILSCPPSGSVWLKSRLLGKTFHYLGLFALVLTLLVSTRAFSPFVLFYSFLWFMYSSLVSIIRDYILCLFHISHGT